MRLTGRLSGPLDRPQHGASLAALASTFDQLKERIAEIRKKQDQWNASLSKAIDTGKKISLEKEAQDTDLEIAERRPLI